MHEHDDIDPLEDVMTADEMGDGPPSSSASPFDEGDAGDQMDQGDGFVDEYLTSADLGADPIDAGDAGDEAQWAESGDDAGTDDMAVWNAFEQEVADGLDAADEDEFLSRVLGGLGRAAGMASRRAGGLRGMAQQAARLTGQAGQALQRTAQAASPTANAAARLARMLGAGGAAQRLQAMSRVAAQMGRAVPGQGMRAQGRTAVASGAGGAAGLAGLAGGAQDVLARLSQLMAAGAGPAQGMDAMMDLYVEDGVDEALPAAVALAARAAARGLGYANVAQLSEAGRRSLVRGVAAATRELVRGAGPRGGRALSPLTRAATRVARRRMDRPGQAVQALRRGLPQAARRLASNPRMVRRLANAPRPLARPTGIGRGMPGAGPRVPRTYRFGGPVTLTIAPR